MEVNSKNSKFDTLAILHELEENQIKQVIDLFGKELNLDTYLKEEAVRCAEGFLNSYFPITPYNYCLSPPEIVEDFKLGKLHIRAPSLFPKSFSVGKRRYSNSELYNLWRMCPTLEEIELHPALRRKGFLKYLMIEMAIREFPYLSISNISNQSFAEYLFRKSKLEESYVESLDNLFLLSFAHNRTQEPSPTFAFDLKKFLVANSLK